MIISNGFAAMGISLPGAIAAKLVHPDRKVVALCGDGGFLMNAQELETAKRIGAAVVVVVWRDDGYGLIDWKQRNEFGRPFAVEFGNPDFVDYAESFGIPGFRPDPADDLYPTLMRALELDGPAVIDVPIDYPRTCGLTERLGALSGLSEARRIALGARRARSWQSAACLAAIVAACGAPGARGRPRQPDSGHGGAVQRLPRRLRRVPASAAASPAPAPSAPGATWARLEVDGAAPSPREDHTWTVDPEAGVAYLFGGATAARSSTTSGPSTSPRTRWTRLRPGGRRPPPRFGHEAAWLPGTGWW